MNKIKGFEPFYGDNSELLILGSFPSVKSRLQNFYYGNPQNAFWRILSRFFCEDEPKSVEDKKEFLLAHKIALWDIVCECEIVGSQDSTIKNFTVADLKILLKKLPIKVIILNGGVAAKIFFKNYPSVWAKCIALPSTSPANARRNDGVWYDALRTIYG